MSENGGKGKGVDMSFLAAVQEAPVGRRGGDATSERGKVREFFVANVLDPMIASQKTDHPIRMVELTDVIFRMRSMAFDKDGKTTIYIALDQKLQPGQKWRFLPNVTPWDERYRGIRNYLTGILKTRKEFTLEKHPSKKHGGKVLTFIVFKQAKAVKA